jgi:protein TonB
LDRPYYRTYELPWTETFAEDRRFQRLSGFVMLLALAIGIVVPFLPTPEPEPGHVEEIPPRIAQLLLEQRPPPPPPKPPEPVPEEQPPEPEQVAEEQAPEPEPVVDRQEVAREQAQAALLPFTEDLVSLVDSTVLETVADNRPLSASVGQAQRNERSMITSKVGTASGGINTASMSRNTGGNGLAALAETAVDTPVDSIGDRSDRARRVGPGAKASRSREEIELVFDRNKGAIFALYNRALRMDPTLEGKLVLRLTIAPNGEVTDCEIISSELGDPELERKLVQRVMLFSFDPKDVEPVTTTKPIDFFPA